MKSLLSLCLTAILLCAGARFAVAPAAAQTTDAPYQIAQADIGYFVDRHGRRVYFDRRTNRIIAVEEPQTLRNLLERVLPPLSADPGPDANTFPPAPPPPPQVGPSPDQPPTAANVPAPGGVERAPLDPLVPEAGTDTARTDDQAPLPDFTQPGPPAGDLADRPSAPDSAGPAAIEPPRMAVPTQDVATLPRPDRPAVADGPVIAKLQILLDRLGFSPGVIDGQMGSNVRKAVAAASEVTGVVYTAADEAAIDAELELSGGSAFAQYVITPEDVAGPFVAAIPADYAEKARLPAMSYTSPAEMLAERFHMAQSYLEALNPGVDFSRPGAVIRVAAVGRNIDTAVARIIADKANKQVRAYDASGRLVAAYPATIGSSDTPSPSGTVQVERVAFDPNYTYNPNINFVQGENRSILTIPPGPNGPVGSIWIALSKPTYGIHGTPDPDRIGKTSSHGCVRLTNWDAAELARLVTKGVTVEFLD